MRIWSFVLLGVVALAVSIGCGGANQRGAVPTEKDSSAALPPASSPDKKGAMSAVAPLSRGDSFVDQTSAAHNGPSHYWHDVSGLGQLNNMTWTYVNGGSISNSMFWQSGQSAGRYEIQVFVPRNYATTHSAKYRIMNGIATVSTVPINQDAYSDAWVSLGTYDFSQQPGVYLGDDTGESYGTKRIIGFDAVKFIQKPSGGGIVVPSFCQTNGAWSAKILKPSKGTMGKIGCLVTSLASVAKWAGTDTDPGQFCDWLSSNKGFGSDGSWINDDKLREYSGGKVRVTASMTAWGSGAADPNVAASEIDAGRPIVLKVHYRDNASNDYQHWVVAVSYTRNGANVDDFQIMDPLNAKDGTVSLKGNYLFGGTFAKKVYGAKLVSR